jgi:hypothetical protein
VGDIDTAAMDSLKVLDPERPIREEKREPVGDIDTAAMDSLKVLDPERPIREEKQTSPVSSSTSEKCQQREVGSTNAKGGGRPL